MNTDHLTNTELVRFARGQGELIDALCERLEMIDGAPVIADVANGLRADVLPNFETPETLLVRLADGAAQTMNVNALLNLLTITTITALKVDPNFDATWDAHQRSWYVDNNQHELF